jgi:XRE family aerobic/anaerobic benzoate catabolism transcriptional regulator
MQRDAMPHDPTRLLLGEIARRVRARRKERGRTAVAVARCAGLSPRFYAQLEAGEANIAIGRLAAVARALAMPLAELVADPQRDRAVALLGLRGAGKSTIGPLVAQALSIPFVELDARIERRAGLWVSEIFSLHGEDYYRRLETECLAELLEGEAPVVVALSGGVVHNRDAFELVRARCAAVWLRARPEDHMRRVVESGDERPVAGRADAMAELRALLDSREPLYRQAHIQVETSGCPVRDVVARICDALDERGWSPRRARRTRERSERSSGADLRRRRPEAGRTRVRAG